jgi:hypothetical protein
VSVRELWVSVGGSGGDMSTPQKHTPTRHYLKMTSDNRRYVLEQSLRYGPLEARRTAFSVALASFWRMRGEVQQPGTVAPGHDKNDSGLRGRGVAPPTSKRFEPRRL